MSGIGYAQGGYPEKFGNTLNLGLGLGYYRHVEHPMPVFHFNYEFDVLRNFTLAPFITFYSYRNSHYWGDHDNHYGYRQLVIPMGVKAAYYFDELLRTNSKWDFYAAGSLGFALRHTSWDNDFDGDGIHSGYGPSPLYVDLHLGTEYHFNQKIGGFLDLSTGVSTIGLAVHF